MTPPLTRQLVSVIESLNSRVSCENYAVRPTTPLDSHISYLSQENHIRAGLTQPAIPLSVGTLVLPRTAFSSVGVPPAHLLAKQALMANLSSLNLLPRTSRSHLCTGSHPLLLHKHSNLQDTQTWRIPPHHQPACTIHIHIARPTTAAFGANQIHSIINSTLIHTNPMAVLVDPVPLFLR